MATPPDNEPSSTQRTISSPSSTPWMAKQKLAAERARLLLGCYRRIDAMDPDTWVLAIALVLSAYEDWVILEATHPRTGIQATEKFKSWPPNSGELKHFCDDMARRALRYAIYEKLPKPNLPPADPAPVPPRSDRMSVEDLARRHEGAAWADRILAAKNKRPAPMSPVEALRSLNESRVRLGLDLMTQAEFDALPDAPSN